MIFEELEKLIVSRKKEKIEASYTYKLLTTQYLVERKVHEELYEVIEAAFVGDKEQLIYEVGDLLYHLLVLLGKYDIPLSAIDEELRRRRKT
jgi:phosphoribosyl-ATP pyrophosphohydrolase